MASMILIVEDEALLARNMRTFLERRDYEVAIADTLRTATKIYEESHPDAVLIDQNLPDGFGVDLIKKIRSSDRLTKLVMVTANGKVETAVEAMKAGADDFLVKPVGLDEIALVLEKLFAKSQIEQSLTYFQTKEERQSGLEMIVGDSSAVNELKSRLRMILNAEKSAAEGAVRPPVLILGETGTGKELIARALHFESQRRNRPFIEVNCAALPDQLVESELFGHERGAFTDARERKAGLFLAADGGTLFLDEVGELPLQTQAKLLRTLEERTIRPVGGMRDRKIDVRVVAATNASLEDKIRQGEFRSDLLYRLNTLTVSSPPLRNRGDDILKLADKFLAQYCARYGRSDLQFSGEAKDALLAHSWPGNVRELRNVIEQACLLTTGSSIRANDLNLREAGPIASIEPSIAAQGLKLFEAERDLIVNALTRFMGNVTLTAQNLGVSRDTLRYRMEKYNIRRDSFQ